MALNSIQATVESLINAKMKKLTMLRVMFPCIVFLAPFAWVIWVIVEGTRLYDKTRIPRGICPSPPQNLVLASVIIIGLLVTYQLYKENGLGDD